MPHPLELVSFSSSARYVAIKVHRTHKAQTRSPSDHTHHPFWRMLADVVDRSRAGFRDGRLPRPTPPTDRLALVYLLDVTERRVAGFAAVLEPSGSSQAYGIERIDMHVKSMGMDLCYKHLLPRLIELTGKAPEYRVRTEDGPWDEEGPRACLVRVFRDLGYKVDAAGRTIAFTNPRSVRREPNRPSRPRNRRQ